MVEAAFLYASRTADILYADMRVGVRPDKVVGGVDQFPAGRRPSGGRRPCRFFFLLHNVNCLLDWSVKST
jgi:hypothetical protein